MSAEMAGYLRKLAELLRGRREGRFLTLDDEEDLHDAMEPVWRALSEDEKKAISGFVAESVREKQDAEARQAERVQAERVRLAGIMAAVIDGADLVATYLPNVDGDHLDQAKIAEDAWDLLEAVEAEGRKRAEAKRDTSGGGA